MIVHADIEHVPSVSGQLPGVQWVRFNDPSPSSTRIYNGSVVRFGGRMLLAARRAARTAVEFDRVLLFEVDREGNATFLSVANLPHIECNHEDPRLFAHRRALHLAYSAFDPRIGVVRQRLVRLDHNLDVAYEYDLDDILPRRLERFEKNWQFISDGDRIVVFPNAAESSYVSLSAKRSVLAVEHEGERACPSPLPAPLRRLRAGTSTVPFNGALLSVLQAHVPVEEKHVARWYGAFFCLRQSKKPFALTHLSRVPFLFGSSMDPCVNEQFARLVVFPAGLCRTAGGCLLSFGVNDVGTAIVHLKDQAIEASLAPLALARRRPRSGMTHNSLFQRALWSADDDEGRITGAAP